MLVHAECWVVVSLSSISRPPSFHLSISPSIHPSRLVNLFSCFQPVSKLRRSRPSRATANKNPPNCAAHPQTTARGLFSRTASPPTREDLPRSCLAAIPTSRPLPGYIPPPPTTRFQARHRTQTHTQTTHTQPTQPGWPNFNPQLARAKYIAFPHTESPIYHRQDDARTARAEPTAAPAA